jgi:thiamine-phosphate diphosphorylase
MSIEMVIRELEVVSDGLCEVTSPLIVPTGGISVAYALPGARTNSETAVITNGITVTSTDLPVCRMVLTACRFDSTIRCVAVIRYNERFISTAEGILLEICSFNRAQEPPGDPTHDWGVAFCCERSEGVPDIIYDTGCAGKEPLIRLLAESPTRVLASINRIVTRIIDTNFTEE